MYFSLIVENENKDKRRKNVKFKREYSFGVTKSFERGVPARAGKCHWLSVRNKDYFLQWKLCTFLAPPMIASVTVIKNGRKHFQISPGSILPALELLQDFVSHGALGKLKISWG